jgi:O-antigen/teichoic acid export membrane protein
MPRSGAKPLSFRIVRSVTFSIARKLVAGPIFLLLVPFTLHRVGAAGYGTWSILGTIIGLGWLLDLGVGSSVTKYIAEHRGRGDASQIRRVLNTSCAVYLLIAAIAVGLLWLFSTEIVKALFRGPAAPSVATVLSLWLWVLPIVAADLLAKPFISVINGFQRMDLSNVLLFGTNVCNALLTVIFLCAGAKLKGLVWAAVITAILNLAVSVGMVRFLLPSIVANPFGADLATARTICSLSLALYSGSIMTTIQGQAEKLYLARFAGVVPVGWYNMASEAASKVRRMPDLLLGPVMAASSELDATNESSKISQLNFRAHKYLAVTAIPLVVYTVIAAKDLMTVWLGPSFAFIAFPFALLVIGNLFPQMGSPTFFVLVGRGIVRPGVYSALISSVLNVVLSLFFIERWGFIGAAWGTVIPMVIGTVYFFWACNRYLETPIYKVLFDAYLKPLLCSLAAAVAMFAVNFYVTRVWPRLFVGSLIYGVIYLAGLGATRFFDAFDFSKMEGHLPFLRLARRVLAVSYDTTG